MALTFEFTTNTTTGKPEIILKASTATAAEKILLQNIISGIYGKIHIEKQNCIQANGMATVVKLAFGSNKKQNIGN